MRWNFWLGKCINSNGNKTDVDGDGCDAYKGHGCGNFDDVDFKAHEMCCSCGGGKFGTKIKHELTK